MDSDTYLLGVPAIPGPTNSLLFVSGVSRGFRTNLSLIFSEVGAYLISISSLVLALAPLMRTYSTVPQLLRMACSIYLIHAGALIQSNAAQRIHLGRVYRGEASLLAGFAIVIFVSATREEQAASTAIGNILGDLGRA